jgi:two-component system response regulator AtoC
MDSLLVIDDSVAFLNDVESLLRHRYKVLKATSGRAGLDILESEQVAAVLLDLKMPEMNGIEVLKRIHTQLDPHLPVIIVTDQSEVEFAVEAMKLGAYDFIAKSFNLNVLTAKIVKALERRSLEISVAALRTSQDEQYDRMIFASEAMKKIHYKISQLAALNFDVLIYGETGVGKDLIAFELHRRGPRRDRPFFPIALKTYSETLIETELFGHEKGAFSGADRQKIGKLEAANGGMVYIPEISTLSESIQLKLLQFMQYKSITRVGQDPKKPEIKLDVRIIMATNESLEDLVKKGTMREDFYHRITGVRLNIPPLRQRVEDIEPLAGYFLKKFSHGEAGKSYELTPDVLRALCAHNWPGNVRELENVIKNAIAHSSGDQLTVGEFPNLVNARSENDRCRVCMEMQFPTLPTYAHAEKNFRRAYFEEIMRRSDDNIAKAAMAAGMTPQGFRKVLNNLKMKKS